MSQKFLNHANRPQGNFRRQIHRLSAKSWLLCLCVGSFLAAQGESTEPTVVPTKTTSPEAQMVDKPNSSTKVTTPSATLPTLPKSHSSNQSVTLQRSNASTSPSYGVQGWFDPLGLSWQQGAKDYKGFTVSPEGAVWCPLGSSRVHSGYIQGQATRNPGVTENSAAVRSPASAGLLFMPEIGFVGGYRNRSALPDGLLGVNGGVTYNATQGHLFAGRIGVEGGAKNFQVSLFGGLGLNSGTTNLPAGVDSAKSAPYVAVSGKTNAFLTPLLNLYLTSGAFLGDKIGGASTLQNQSIVSHPIFLQFGGFFQLLKMLQLGFFVKTENLFNSEDVGTAKLSYKDFCTGGLHLRFNFSTSTKWTDIQTLSGTEDIERMDPFAATTGVVAVSYLSDGEVDDAGSCLKLETNCEAINKPVEITMNADALVDQGFNENTTIYLGIKSAQKFQVLNAQGQPIPSPRDGAFTWFNFGKLKKDSDNQWSLPESMTGFKIQLGDNTNAAKTVIPATQFFISKEMHGASAEFAVELQSYSAGEDLPKSSDVTTKALSTLPQGIEAEPQSIGALAVTIQPGPNAELIPGGKDRKFLTVSVESSSGAHPYSNTANWMITTQASSDPQGGLDVVLSLVDENNRISQAQREALAKEKFTIRIGNDEALVTGLSLIIPSESGDGGGQAQTKYTIALSDQAKNFFIFDAATNSLTLGQDRPLPAFNPLLVFTHNTDSNKNFTVPFDPEDLTKEQFNAGEVAIEVKDSADVVVTTVTINNIGSVLLPLNQGANSEPDFGKMIVSDLKDLLALGQGAAVNAGLPDVFAEAKLTLPTAAQISRLKRTLSREQWKALGGAFGNIDQDPSAAEMNVYCWKRDERSGEIAFINILNENFNTPIEADPTTDLSRSPYVLLVCSPEDQGDQG